jgi:hypothetical protein
MNQRETGNMEENASEHRTATPSIFGPYYPAKSAEERLAALRALRGMWKGRDPDPVEYFETLRQEPDRELPARSR